MAFSSPLLALHIWNLPTDPYDSDQLAENWARVDQHDHSPGKGSQIPTSGIQDGAITAVKVAPSAFPSLNLADDAVTASKIAPGAVTSQAIATGAVTASAMGSASVGASALAGNAVTAPAIASGAVGSAALATNAVVTNALTNASVTPPKLGNATWSNFTLLNGWTWPSTSGTVFPSYSNQCGSFVYLRGGLRGGSINQTICTLPSNLRPSYQEYITAVTGGNTVSPLLVHTDGSIQLLAGDATFLSFDGVRITVG